MKKIIFTSMLCMTSSIILAQLKVTSDGKVGIGITGTPTSKLAVGTTGENYCRNVFHTISGEAVNMRIVGAGNSPHSYGDFGAAMYVVQNVSSTRGDYGIRVEAVRTSSIGSGRAIGISASAGNATAGYNWAVVGNLEGTKNGAAILGCLGMSQGYVISDGRYAGYFVGDVKVTGVLNGVVVGNSDIRYKDNVTEISKVSKSTVLSTITQLNPVSYNYKQIYFETENNADSLNVNTKAGKPDRQKLYDEKSPMFKKKHFGLVAQDLRAIYPDLVYENDNGYLAINYIELIPLLIQSIKELKDEVDLLSTGLIKARTTTSNDIIEDTPHAVLYQNAPNPFTNSTVIKFALPEYTTNASIMIFNLQGALVKQIPVNYQQVSITINGSELTAGMYVYSLIVEGKEVDTKRMILTK